MRSFAIIKLSQNREKSVSCPDVFKSCQSREFPMWQICLLTLFAKIKFSRNFRVYSISQLIRFARVYSNVDDFNNRILFLTAKLLKQG